LQEQEERSARDIATGYWDALLELQPLLGTYVGDERFDDRLPDPSPEGLAREQAFHERALSELEGVDRSALSEDLRTTLDLIGFGSTRSLSDLRHRIDRLQVVGHLFGPAGLLADLASLQRADSPERLERYRARLAATPAYFRAVVDVARDGIAAGQTGPGLVVDRTIGQVERLLALGPADSPGMLPVASASDADRERVEAVLRGAVWPAYQSFLDLLREYRPHATESLGVSSLPDGEALYASQILAFTTLPLEAKRVHEIGLEEFAAIQDERRAIARSLGFETAEAAVADLTARGENVAASRQDLLRMVEDQVRRSMEAAPRLFGRLPRSNCDVRPVEEFREDDMPGAFYQGPSADGTRSGVYYLNTSHLPDRPLHQVATTTYHEANPGHHFQISIEIEHAERLPLRRFGGFLSGDAFTEGWGLYSERVADELGLFVNEYERLGMLEAQGTRACRLIVDSGIHALGWDRERAVRQIEEAGLSRMDSEIEVDRYVSWPGQALAYMIGQLEIQRWRREASAANGSAFDVRAFHDRLLSLGSLPLGVLERELSAPPTPPAMAAPEA
jgi:uncharacterized protein (DUF885 family)